MWNDLSDLAGFPWGAPVMDMLSTSVKFIVRQKNHSFNNHQCDQYEKTGWKDVMEESSKGV